MVRPESVCILDRIKDRGPVYRMVTHWCMYSVLRVHALKSTAHVRTARIHKPISNGTVKNIKQQTDDFDACMAALFAVCGVFVSGKNILAVTRAAGADMKDAANRWDALIPNEMKIARTLPAIVAKPPTMTACISDLVISFKYGLMARGATVWKITECIR